jgi:type IV pilus assembly protein PilC
MLNMQAEEFTKNLEYSLKKLGDMLEPILIIFVCVLVAIILISMYLPMFKLGGIMWVEICLKLFCIYAKSY